MRILEVVTNIHVGGIERWLVEIARRIDRDRVRLDFACRTIFDQPRHELETLGCRVHVIPDLQHPVRGLRAMQALNRSAGPYDAVHTHLHHMAGMILWMARWSGIRRRIAHSHVDSRPIERNAGRRFLARNAALATLIRAYATDGLACGQDAAASLFGENWRRDPRFQVLLYGIDLQSFQRQPGQVEVRRQLGIPLDAFVVGNIGRFAPQKNHTLFVEVAAALVRRTATAHFLLIGDGPLRAEVERQIDGAGLTARVRIVTGRTDVANLTPAMDAFLFPSVYEGLGIALLEAQASGLPCLLTDTLPPEVSVIPSLLKRVPLAAAPDVWATTLLEHCAAVSPTIRREAWGAVERSPFNIDVSGRRLQEFYLDPDRRSSGRREALLGHAS